MKRELFEMQVNLMMPVTLKLWGSNRCMCPSLTSQVLIEQIASAFANVGRWVGVTLHQAIALDSYASDEAVAAARLQDTNTPYGFDRSQSLVSANFLRFVVGKQGENAESQAVLQIIWAWANFVKEQDND